MAFVMIVNKNTYVANRQYRVWEGTAISDPDQKAPFFKEANSVLYPLTYPYWLA